MWKVNVKMVKSREMYGLLSAFHYALTFITIVLEYLSDRFFFIDENINVKV